MVCVCVSVCVCVRVCVHARVQCKCEKHYMWTNLIYFRNFNISYRTIVVFYMKQKFCCPVGSGYLSDGSWNAPAARQLSTFIPTYRQGHDTDTTDVAILSHAMFLQFALFQFYYKSSDWSTLWLAKLGSKR